MKPFVFFLFLTISFLPLTTIAQQDTIDVFISNQMKQQGVIGLSIGIVKNGKIIKAKGYGQANIEWRLFFVSFVVRSVLCGQEKEHKEHYEPRRTPR